MCHREGLPSPMAAPSRDPAAFRRRLHAAPELSGEERETAVLIAATLAELNPARLETALGGHGVAACFGPDSDDDSITLRAELDALPIDEQTQAPHASTREGTMHACGHDGHMACLVEIARRLAASPPERRVTLLFQPAEETGEGAAAVIDDPRWRRIRGRRAFAYHNDPGRPLAQLAVRDDVMACASIGLRVQFLGATAHTSLPERDNSAALVAARFIQRMPVRPSEGEPLRMTTIAHASVGEPTFGVSPGAATIHVSCRGQSTQIRDGQAARVRDLARELAAGDFEVRITEDNPFVSTHNDAACVEAVRAAGAAALLDVVDLPEPQRWSEDFGRLMDDAPDGGALFLLGSGENQPPLHDPRFDFPDELIAPAAHVLERLARG